MIPVDVYPVGLLRDWLHARRTGEWRARARWFARSWRRRSYWNGYLAEHPDCHHNAGRGWTERVAVRRVDRICSVAAVSGVAGNPEDARLNRPTKEGIR